MLPVLPRYASLKKPSIVRPARNLPPVTLAVRVSPHVDLADPRTLLRPCVAITATMHPVLDTLLRRAGARVTDGTYHLAHPAAQAPDPLLVAAVTSVHPGTWIVTWPSSKGRADRGGDFGAGPVVDLWGAALAEAFTHAGIDLERPAILRKLCGAGLRVTRAGRTLRLTPITGTLAVGGTAVGLGSTGRVLLTPLEGARAIIDARMRGLVVLDADHPGRLADLDWLLDRHCLLAPVAGAPGWAQLSTGALVTSPAGSPLPAAEAATLVAGLRGDVASAAHQSVLDTAAVAHAAPAGRDGLRPWQDTFVSAYLACGRGLVNALPPGSGKTVCAAAAMAARAGQDTRPYKAVVLAPAGLRIQWERELHTFFPAADVSRADSGAQMPTAVARFRDASEPAVLLLSADTLAASPDLLEPVMVDDLVVDEGVYLRVPTSDRSRAAWQLRTRSRQAMVLTGTPDERGQDAVAALVSFALNDRDLFAEYPLSGPHPDVPGDRVGPWLFTGAGAVSTALPTADVSSVELAAGPVETAIDAAARARINALVGTSATSKRAARRNMVTVRAELEAWRLGLACPTALASSRYALAADAKTALAAANAAGGDDVAARVGHKLAWAVAAVRSEVADGGQVLLFSDFRAVLDAAAAELAVADVPAAVLSSSVTPKRRQMLVDSFVAGTLPVLLISATGHLGLNLASARTVIHLDVPATAAALTQRSARAARMGNRHDSVSVQVPVLTGCGDQSLLDVIGRQEQIGDVLTLATDLTVPRARRVA